MRKKALIISICALILIGIGCYGYNIYKLTPKSQITKISLLSEAKLDDNVKKWADSLKDSEGIYMAKVTESNDTVKYYLLASNYRMDYISVNNNYKHQEIDINVTENINKEQASTIREDIIQGDKTKTVVINGEKFNVSNIAELE